jgi:hypothetical protein
VTATDSASRQLIAAAACLLDQGCIVDGLSRLVTATALFVLMLPVVLPASPQKLPAVILSAVAVLGAIEAFFAVRVGFDAALFRRLATGSGPLDFNDLDNALSGLGLTAERRADRSAADRVTGARRLFYRQTVMLILQIGLSLAAALLAWA